MVQVLPERQILPCLVCLRCLEDRVCRLLGSSGLSPRLFIMYSVDLADRAVEHDVNFHGYADDTQLYVHCRPQDIAETTAKLERCITDMGYWMSGSS